MVKSYLRYKNEVNFGTVNSQSCKSIQFLTYNHILTGTDDSVSVWDVKVDEIKIKFEFTKNEFYSPCLVQCFILTNCNNARNLTFGNNHGIGVNQGKLAKDEQLFVGYADGTIRRFRLDCDKINSILFPTESSEGLAFLHRGQVGANFEVKSGNFGFFLISEEATLLGHKSSVTCLTLSSNEKLLISGGKDHRVVVWRSLDGQVLCQLDGHTDEILSINYHPSFEGNSLVDNRNDAKDDELGFVISGSKDNSIRFWGIWSTSCFDTLIEPLFQLSGFSILNDKLFVWFRNNDSVKCYDISQVGQVKLLFSLTPKETNLKCQNIFLLTVDNNRNTDISNDKSDTNSKDQLDKNEQLVTNKEVGGKKVLVAVYNKFVYFYELLDEDKRERKKQKRERRVVEKMKTKVRKLKRLVGEAKIPFNTQLFKSLTDLSEKYNYLKNILNPFNTSKNNNDNNELVENEEVKLSESEEKLEDSDYYDLLDIYSLSETSVNVSLFNDYLALGYLGNNVDIFRVNCSSFAYDNSNNDNKSSSNIVNDNITNNNEDDKIGGKGEKLVKKCNLGRFHRDPIKVAVLSPNNKVLVTLSSSSLFLFNTLSNNPICSFSDYLSFSDQFGKGEGENDKNSLQERKVKISDIVNLAFANHSNLVLLTRRNTLCVLSLSSNSLVFQLELHSLEEEVANFHLVNLGSFEGVSDLKVGENAKTGLREGAGERDYGQNLLVFLICRKNLVRVLKLGREEKVLGELRVNGEIISSKVNNEYIYLNMSNSSILVVKNNCWKMKSDLGGENRLGNLLHVKLTLFGHKLPIVDLSASDDNLLLVSGSKDKTVKIWDVRFGNIVKTLIQNNVIKQVEFLRNTHYILTVDLRNCVRLFDCDLLTPITEISTFFRHFNCFVISNYNQFFYLIGNEFTICKFVVDPGELVFPEEEAERLEDAKIFKSGQLIVKLENIINLLEELGDELDWNGLKLVNEAIEGVNFNLIHELIISLPYINIQQLLRAIIEIFQLVTKKGCVNLINLEKLIYVSLGISQVYLRQFVSDKSLIYDLKRFTRLFLNDYLDLVYFNKSGLEHIKNAIEKDERQNLKRLMRMELSKRQKYNKVQNHPSIRPPIYGLPPMQLF